MTTNNAGKRKQETTHDTHNNKKKTSTTGVDPQEAKSLGALAARHLLLSHHAHKNLTRQQLREQLLPPERKDAGRILSAALACANEMLADVIGLEAVHLDPDGAVAAEVAASQSQQQQPSQPDPTQSSAPPKATAATKLRLVNRLDSPVRPPTPAPLKAYHALVEVTLAILSYNDGTLLEEKLCDDWFPKLGLKVDAMLPHANAKVGDLVKRMVHDGFLKREAASKALTIGPNSIISCDVNAAAKFRKAVMRGQVS